METGTKILIVDDDPDVLFATVRILKKAGYETIQATNGEEALGHLQSANPELVLLDVVLGDTDGLEILKQIKTRYPGIFVILVSGARIKSHDQTIGLDSGADGYITRPFGQEEFLAHIGAMVRIQHAEVKLKTLIKEKEILVREVYHRVKNNFVMVTSLLNLQLREIDDPKAVALFKETRDRIKSMVEIHRLLYQADNITEINFQEYLKQLVKDLFHTYNSGNPKLRLLLDLDPVTINVDQAIPCGLIVNELVTNALKYAFPAGQAGEIKVVLSENEIGEIKLTVSDTGVGISEEASQGVSGSLGMKLVHLLVDQLEGTLDIERTTGVSFVIQFQQKE
ncbi:response regulator [bacterium]|nr:MAG: response regulator [bacterium]